MTRPFRPREKLQITSPDSVSVIRLSLLHKGQALVWYTRSALKLLTCAGILCIVTLNRSPLVISDFKGLISEDRVFKDINSAVSFLSNWCQPYS